MMDLDVDGEVTMQQSHIPAQPEEGDVDMKNTEKVGTLISFYAMCYAYIFPRVVMLTLTKTKTTLPVLMGLDFL